MKKFLLISLIFVFSLTLSGCFLSEEKEEIPPQAMKIIEPSSLDPNTLPVYTFQEVASHSTAEDCWMIINSDVIDATSFFGKHPGGEANLLKGCGKDATEMFASVKKHNPSGYEKAKELTIGIFVEDTMEMIDPSESVQEESSEEE